jgi:hypothetical protein
MLHPVLHIWSKTVTALTAETLLELFQEAVDLRPGSSHRHLVSEPGGLVFAVRAAALGRTG